MERLKIYIESESEKKWRKYKKYLSEEGNMKDLERFIMYMFEDILPENELKNAKSQFSRMSKGEKLQVMERSESFFQKYVQTIFRKNRNIDEIVVKSIVKSFKDYKHNIERKKQECQEHMKKIVQFYIELKKSERILLTERSVDFSFKNKSVLTSKMLNNNELGEIFGRYLMADMFDMSSYSSDFYKNIFEKIKFDEYESWHPLFKYWIFLFVIIEQLFKKDSTDFTPLFSTKKVKKLIYDISILTYSKEKQEEFKRIEKKHSHHHQRGEHHQRGGHTQSISMIGGHTQSISMIGGHTQSISMIGGGGGVENILKKVLKNTGQKKKKKGEKKKYDERNPLINFYNKMLKETRVYNVYTGTNSTKKSDDTLYSIFLENNIIKEKVKNYYNELLFSENSKYCPPKMDGSKRQCDLKEKVPMIFAEQNPDAYFSIEKDLFSDKTGPKKDYEKSKQGMDENNMKQILETLSNKLTFYKGYLVYDDKYMAKFLDKLKEFQINLIYLMYSLYLKKYNLYKTFVEILDDIMKDVEKEIIIENNEENNMNGNRNQNNGKNVLDIVQEQLYIKNAKLTSKLSETNIKKLNLIYDKIKKIQEYKSKIEKEEYGTPEYNTKHNQIDKYIQMLRIEAQKIIP